MEQGGGEEGEEREEGRVIEPLFISLVIVFPRHPQPHFWIT